MLSKTFKKAIFPYLHRICDVCSLPLEVEEEHWCTYCEQQFLDRPHCRCCGLPTIMNEEHCGECLTSPPMWHRLYCLGDYTFPLQQEIHSIKFHRQFWRTGKMTHRLAEKINEKPDLITSVPLHWKRQLYRGFNQSELIATQLAKALNRPCATTLFQRKRSTPYQRNLTRVERQKNMQGAFFIKHKNLVLHKHIAICDDVVTTGSTVNQLCQILLDHGVERIDIYCLCRTSHA